MRKCLLSGPERKLYRQVEAKKVVYGIYNADALLRDEWVEGLVEGHKQLLGKACKSNDVSNLWGWLRVVASFETHVEVRTLLRTLRALGAKCDFNSVSQYLGESFGHACYQGDVKTLCLLRRMAQRADIGLDLIRGFEDAAWHSCVRAMCLLGRWIGAHPVLGKRVLLGNGIMILRAATGHAKLTIRSPWNDHRGAIRLLERWGDSVHGAIVEARRRNESEAELIIHEVTDRIRMKHEKMAVNKLQGYQADDRAARSSPTIGSEGSITA